MRLYVYTPGSTCIVFSSLKSFHPVQLVITLLHLLVLLTTVEQCADCVFSSHSMRYVGKPLTQISVRKFNSFY